MMARSFARALVTGASSGIGVALARELAHRDTTLVLVARNEAKLVGFADELRTELGVGVEVLPADLTDRDELAVVEERLRSAEDPIDLLVNNAGAGQVGRFDELDVDDAQHQVVLNVIAPLRLAHASLPRLRATKGGLLNVSSIGGNQPVPYMATYAATKAFVTSWTEALHEEMRGTGVHVTTLAPGFTRTDFADRADADRTAGRIPGFVWADPAAVARAGLDGVARGRAMVTPGPLYRLGAIAGSFTPSTVSRRAIGTVIDIVRD